MTFKDKLVGFKNSCSTMRNEIQNYHNSDPEILEVEIKGDVLIKLQEVERSLNVLLSKIK